MAGWRELERVEPAFATRVRERLDIGKHKTMATLRADGSPRISGIEVEFQDGELVFGSMPGARKLADLLRDPPVRAARTDGGSTGGRADRLAG